MIEILSKDNCPQCTMAKSKLKLNNIDFIEINMNVKNDFKRFQELISISSKLGIRTVPQFFQDDKYLGSFEDIDKIMIDCKKVKVTPTIQTVIKRNGNIEVFSIDKLKCGGLDRNDIASSLYDKCSTTEIEELIIRKLVDTHIYENNKVASEIFLERMYMDAYGTKTNIPDFVEIYEKFVNQGLWRPMLYGYDDLVDISNFIDHSRDYNYQYASLLQYRHKYSLRDINTKRIYETPQITIIGIAMAKFESTSDSIERILQIKDYYDFMTLDMAINEPTPIMAGLRTPSDMSASCCVIDIGDSSQSIEAGIHAMSIMTENRAGIGVNLDIRSIGDSVKNGLCFHSGKFPYLKKIYASVSAVSQGSRGGGATITYKCIDPELFDLVIANLPRAKEEKRLLHLKFSIAVNSYLFKAAELDRKWALVSIKNCPELHALFYRDDMEEFENLMEKILLDDSIPKTVVDAREIFRKYIYSRRELGQHYQHDVTNALTHTPFEWRNNDIIKCSNLCHEIELPIRSFGNIQDLFEDLDDALISTITETGLVSLCMLGGIDIYEFYNMTEENKSRICELVLTGIDNIIDTMVYPFPNIASTNKIYRPVGIGTLNLAKLIAENELEYGSPESLKLIHEAYESFYYHLLSVSVQLAKTRGKCPIFENTRWKDGWLPIDTYSKALDEFVEPVYHYDWEKLREDVIKYGVRFSVLSAHMPTETSATFTGCNNGVYPVIAREEYSFKDTNIGTQPFFFPRLSKGKYTFAYDINPMDMIKVYATIQKFTDQGISADTFSVSNENLKMSDLFEELNFAHKLGIKTFYYANTLTGRGTNQIECDSCKL